MCVTCELRVQKMAQHSYLIIWDVNSSLDGEPDFDKKKKINK